MTVFIGLKERSNVRVSPSPSPLLDSVATTDLSLISLSLSDLIVYGSCSYSNDEHYDLSMRRGMKRLPSVNNPLSILDAYLLRETMPVAEDSHQQLVLIRIRLVGQLVFV